MQKKKLLGSALALAMLVPYSQAYADVMKNLKVDGSIDMQATSADNVGNFNSHAYDQVGDAQARIVVNAGWDLLDDVHAMVTVRDNSLFMGSGPSNTAPTGPGSNSQSLSNPSGSAVGANGNGVLDDIYFDQGYIKVDKVFGAVDTTLGRQYYGTPGDIVIYFGPYANLYGLPTSAIDAARFDWSNDQIGVTGLAGKFKGSVVNATEAADVDLQGVNAVAKGNDMWNAGAYVWEKETHNGFVNGGNDYLWVAGLKGKISAGPAWLKAEFDKNAGENKSGTSGLGGYPATSMNYDGWAFKVDLGAKQDVGVATVEPWAQFADASGGAHNNKNFTFTGINPDYRPGGIYGYFSSINGLGGHSTPTQDLEAISNGGVGDRTVWGIGFKATPAAVSKLTAGVSYWDYRYQSLNGEGVELGSNGAGISNKHIGSELDVALTWKHSDNVSFNVGAGQFWAGGAIDQINGASHTGPSAAGTSPATMFQAGTSVKF